MQRVNEQFFSNVFKLFPGKDNIENHISMTYMGKTVMFSQNRTRRPPKFWLPLTLPCCHRDENGYWSGHTCNPVTQQYGLVIP